MIQHTARIQVRYAETDMMGIAYHGSYLPWLEIGRTELLRAAGVPYRELEQQGYFLPVLEIQMKYLRPARYDEFIEVQARIAEKPSLRIRVHYALARGEERIATAETLHAFIDKTGRPVRPPLTFSQRMEALFHDLPERV